MRSWWRTRSKAISGEKSPAYSKELKGGGLKMESPQTLERLQNSHGDSCAFCGRHRGVIPIQDIKHRQFWICEDCDRDIDWE